MKNRTWFFDSIEKVKEIIKPYPDNPDIQRIVNQFYDKRELIELEGSDDRESPELQLFLNFIHFSALLSD